MILTFYLTFELTCVMLVHFICYHPIISYYLVNSMIFVGPVYYQRLVDDKIQTCRQGLMDSDY